MILPVITYYSLLCKIVQAKEKKKHAHLKYKIVIRGGKIEMKI